MFRKNKRVKTDLLLSILILDKPLVGNHSYDKPWSYIGSNIKRFEEKDIGS